MSDDQADLVTERREGEPLVTRDALQIEVIEGPDKGKTFVLSPSGPLRVFVGTSPACDVRLTDPTVSRRHLAFEPAGVRFRVTDLGSSNGTSIDGTRVVDAFVIGGEVLRCGATAMRAERRPLGAAEAPLPSRMRFGRTVGASESMRRLYPLCEKLAAARMPVLIEGETGTGKEVLAESLHDESGLAGPFVVFDCTAVSPALVEAELFGHERGAFTGAVNSRPGVFELARGGTVFIDEIGDFDLSLQPKLLRAIDRGEIRRVGGKDTIATNVRILAATRRDLDREVAAGRFRDDLFHRLTVGRVELPPLRERAGDVTLLARFFVEQLGAPPESLTRDLLARLEDYAWPGNVRELRNAIVRHIALGELTLTGEPRTGTRSQPPPPDGADAALDAFIDATLDDKLAFPLARRKVQEHFERRYVARLLEAHGGNVSKASMASGIARRYFQLVKARSGGGR